MFHQLSFVRRLQRGICTCGLPLFFGESNDSGLISIVTALESAEPLGRLGDDLVVFDGVRLANTFIRHQPKAITISFSTDHSRVQHAFTIRPQA